MNISTQLLDVSRHEIPALVAALLARLMEPEREENQLLTADQVADRLQVDRQWVYRHQRHLGPIRLSRKRLRFRSQAVERYIDSRGKVASRR